MSDQNYPRSYRTSDPNQRGASGAGSDPLAELARLIGQSDPFAEFGRTDHRAREQSDDHQADDHQAPDARGWHTGEQARDDFGTQPDQYQGDSQPYAEHDQAEAGHETAEAGYDHDRGYDRERDQEPAPRARGIRFFGAAAEPAASYADEAHTAGDSDHGYAEEGYADEQGYSEHAYAEQGTAEDGYARGHGTEAVESAAEPDAYADHERRDYAHVLDEEQPYSEHAAAAEEHADEADYGAGPPWAAKHPLAPAEDAAVDEPRARRRGGMLTVIAVLGLAFMGTAGAFTYRAMVVAKGTNPPPVIKASTAPVKVVPAAQAADPSKAPDRLGDGGGQNERMVPHEEQPVNLQEAATPAPPRPVFPDPVAPAGAPAAGPALAPSGPGFPPPVAPRTAAALPPGAAGAVGATGAAGAASGPQSEPKKVRTVTIRPEGEQAGHPAAPAAPARTANAAAPAGNDVVPPRAAAPARSAPAAAAQGNGPLAIAPGAAPPAAAHAHAAAATRTASVSSAGEGAYAAQVSSQHSEAEAQASFRSLRHKYGSVFGDREPIIRKVNIPGKGTFYRTLVGGFASAQEAGQFCNSLRAAGGQCLIQRN